MSCRRKIWTTHNTKARGRQRGSISKKDEIVEYEDDNIAPPRFADEGHGKSLMNAASLIAKIERLRAAVDAAEERDVASVKVEITHTPDRIEMRHDFRGGMADPEIQNLAWQIIRSIADLKDHLRAWAAANGKPKDEVDKAVRSSQELAVLMDLANYDKHGGHDRHGGQWSGTWPELKNIRRGLRITTGAAPGAMAGMQILPNGEIRTVGDTAITVLGEIELRDGRKLEIGYVQQRAIEAWEDLFHRFGLAV
jgi:hypothetical protein